MNPSDWKLTKESLAEAMELSGSERDDYLSRLALEVRTEVERLLQADSNAAGFIDEPILIERGVVNGPDDLEAGVGDVIDGYKLIRKIGSGGMGTVYYAERAGGDFDQKVAIKLIKRGMDTAAVLKRFLMERQILASLDHPNIARMLDGGSTIEGLPYFMMEYVDGQEVRAFCNSSGLELAERLILFRKICDAVASAHQKLVVHRDIKPSNILVTKEGEPKLLDFGIAKLLSPDWNTDTNEATVTQFRVMTPEYASPEQIAGEATTTSTDVYSLGVVLYELLTGERPHETRGKSPKQIADSVLSSEPPKPSTVGFERSAKTVQDQHRTDGQPVPGASKQKTPTTRDVIEPKHLQGDLDNIVLKAMRRDPERRYQSVQEFSEDIRRYLDGMPVTATADSRVYRFNKYFKRHRVGMVGAAAVAGLLLAATAATTWQYTVAQREKAAAERRFADTRALAKSVLYELYDAIDAIPGSTKAKELLALKAIEYLDRLAAEGTTDPYLMTELADGYQRIGDIQGGMNRSNLGQTGEAKNSYAKARSLREAVIASGASDPKFRLKLSMAYTKAAETDFLEANAQGFLANHLLALETLKKLETELSEDEDYLFELGAAYLNYGRAAVVNGLQDPALESLQKGEAIILDLHQRNPSDLTRAMAVSTANDMLAELYSINGRRAEASYHLKRSASYIFPLLPSNPDNAELYKGAAITYYSISKNECDAANYAEAMVNAQRAVEISEDQLLRDAENFEMRTLYAMALYSKARILVRSGKPNDGLPILQDVLKRAEALMAADPDNEIISARTAYVEDEIGRAFLAIGLSTSQRSARIAALQKAKASLQRAHASYQKYRNAMVGEEAALIDEAAAGIARCDAELKAASRG